MIQSIFKKLFTFDLYIYLAFLLLKISMHCILTLNLNGYACAPVAQRKPWGSFWGKHNTSMRVFDVKNEIYNYNCTGENLLIKKFSINKGDVVLIKS